MKRIERSGESVSKTFYFASSKGFGIDIIDTVWEWLRLILHFHCRSMTATSFARNTWPWVGTLKFPSSRSWTASKTTSLNCHRYISGLRHTTIHKIRISGYSTNRWKPRNRNPIMSRGVSFVPRAENWFAVNDVRLRSIRNVSISKKWRYHYCCFANLINESLGARPFYLWRVPNGQVSQIRWSLLVEDRQLQMVARSDHPLEKCSGKSFKSVPWGRTISCSIFRFQWLLLDE